MDRPFITRSSLASRVRALDCQMYISAKAPRTYKTRRPHQLSVSICSVTETRRTLYALIIRMNFNNDFKVAVKPVQAMYDYDCYPASFDIVDHPL